MNDYCPQISIIIPTYHDWDRLRLCLESLARQTYPKDKIEVIVVNNDPSDPAPEMGFDLQLTVISEHKPGSYAARNAGLKIARGEIIGFTDSDCIPMNDWIGNAIKAFELLPDSGRVTGPVDLYRIENSSWMAWKFESITSFNQRYNVKRGVAVTANLFVRRELFDQVGVFNEEMFSGGDYEWNQRAEAHRSKLSYVDNVCVMHPARATFLELVNKQRRVVGGGYARSKRDGRPIDYTLKLLVPPIKYSIVLLSDGKKISEVLFAALILWFLKASMVFEILRIKLGGKLVR
jgi:cellulose synthase/poly-beta-1,6-N-acetylglucosamine synthase-like glycosyltransferase